MARRAAIEVPVPELIRRGYDRAKGLGHDGPEKVRLSHRDFLADLRSVAPGELPAPADLNGAAHLVFDPDLFVGIYRPAPSPRLLPLLMSVLEGESELWISHGWLKHAVAAFQRQGADVRAVPVWIASMTVMPRWAGPAAQLPEAAAGLSEQARVTLAAAISAQRAGPTLLVAPDGPLAQVAMGLDGLKVSTR